MAYIIYYQMDQKIKIAFSIIAIARILQAFLDYNYDWPDQYWQGPQIAYKLINGYGFQTWQWTMEQPIRSIIYPAYLSIGYLVGNIMKAEPLAQQRMVKFMQIALAILCDWFLLRIALIYNNRLTITTSLLILSNWFYFSMMNRTYSNSAEACLTVVAFYYWLVRDKAKQNDLISRIVVGLCFMIRTTSVIVWAVIWPYQLLTMRSHKMKFIFKNVIQILAMAIASILFNSLWYNKSTFVEYNFFKYNILLKWSQLYGINSYFYYFTFAIPLILGAYIIPLLISLFTIAKNEGQNPKKNDDVDKPIIVTEQKENKLFRNLCLITLAILLVLSFSAHKQSRFLLIVTPYLLILCSKGIHKLQNSRLVLFAIISINIILFIVLGLYGKSGGIKILRDLRRDIADNQFDYANDVAVIYLCQPHSLPSYSVIQKNVTLRLLDTSPLRKLQNFNQEIELKQNPHELYNQLTWGLSQKSAIYVIIQQRYSIFNGYLRPQYQFLLQNGFSLIKSARSVNLFQQYYGNFDGFALLKKV